MARSGGRWGNLLTPEILSTKLNDLLFDVPEYNKTMTYHPFTPEQVIIIRFVGECSLCGRTSKTGRGMIAHHREPLGAAELKNGRCLCKSCHDWVSFMLRKVKSYPSGVTKESYYHIEAKRPISKTIRNPVKKSSAMTVKQKRMLYVLGEKKFSGTKREASDRIKELIQEKKLGILNVSKTI